MTLAYIGALPRASPPSTATSAFAEVGAVYLGASHHRRRGADARGLGALEAALVAGLTGVGMDSGVAVAAVLSYRLVTYWLPILPGWLASTCSNGAGSSERPGRGGRPSPPRPKAHRENVPASSPRPAPPMTSRGRWAPAYDRATATSTARPDHWPPTTRHRRRQHRGQGEGHGRVPGDVAESRRVLVQVDPIQQRAGAAPRDERP